MDNTVMVRSQRVCSMQNKMSIYSIHWTNIPSLRRRHDLQRVTHLPVKAGKCLRIRLVLPSACFAKGHDANFGAAVMRALALHQCGPGQNLDPVS